MHPTMMITRFTPRVAAALPLLALAACQDHPAASPASAAPEAPAATLAVLRCAADVRAGTLSCSDAASEGGGARRTLLVVGGQHRYVRLTSSGTSYDAGTDVLSSTVTVQNLLLATLGTADGTTPAASGVRVFFASGPSDGVTVANADGTGTFTAGIQPYFHYNTAELGGDGMLFPSEISAGKVWRFAMNGATAFTFTVLVQAEVPASTPQTVHFTQVAGGEIHACGLTAEGKAYCWGADMSNQLGDGSAAPTPGIPTPVTVPAGVVFTSLSASLHSTCGVTTDGRIFCWGAAHGQMKDQVMTGQYATAVELLKPDSISFTAVTLGGSNSCALDQDGNAYCWGLDSFGQLGNGPQQVVEQVTPTPVSMPAQVTFTSISAGGVHTCAIGSDHMAYCWGAGGWGALGTGTQDDWHVPKLVELPAGEVGFDAVSGGLHHTCALGRTGAAYCWGSESHGQLGDGAPLVAQWVPARVEVAQGLTFTAISAREFHTCAVGSDGKGYCWGRANNLGNGSDLIAAQPTPTEVVLPAGVTLTGLSSGLHHTCAVGPQSSYCWGWNDFGQVGDGTNVTRYVAVAVAATR